MNIYLIRHGDTHNGITDPSYGLSIMGVFQTKCLGSRLTQYKIERIYSSDEACALQTTNIISEYLAADILTRHDLRNIDRGNFSRGWEFLNEFHPDFSEKFSKHIEDVPYPGGENGHDVMVRSNRVIEEILQSGCNNIAVVTHMANIQALICGFLGLGLARRFFLGAPLEYCSISIIKHDKARGSFTLQTMNDYAHLEILNRHA